MSVRVLILACREDLNRARRSDSLVSGRAGDRRPDVCGDVHVHQVDEFADHHRRACHPGPSDLEAVDRALLPQVLQDTAWQLAFRQGSPQDAERMQALFGKAWTIDEAWSSDGRVTKRQVERWRVSIDEFMNALEPGDAWLRVAPVDGRWRQERVRVALPRAREMSSEKALGKSFGNHARNGAQAFSEVGVEGAPEPSMPPRGLPPVPPDCPRELLEKIGADIRARSNDGGRGNTTSSGRAWCGSQARRPSRPPRGTCTGGRTTLRSGAATRRIWWSGGAYTGQFRRA